MMRAQTSETRASVVAFAPKKGPPDATMMTDDAGQHVIFRGHISPPPAAAHTGSSQPR
jgi:hypothetical protein